jgi:hypothetical protein
MILISCRVHPGEPISSFMVEGIIDFLMGRSNDVTKN